MEIKQQSPLPLESKTDFFSKINSDTISANYASFINIQIKCYELLLKSFHMPFLDCMVILSWDLLDFSSCG